MDVGGLRSSPGPLTFEFFRGSESRKNFAYGDLMTLPLRVALIGAGGMARYHIRQMLKMQSTTRIVALCEPSEAMALKAASVFVEPPAGCPALPALGGAAACDQHGTAYRQPAAAHRRAGHWQDAGGGFRRRLLRHSGLQIQ